MEVTPAHQSVPVTEPSQPSAARLAAKGAAERASFDEEDAYRAGLLYGLARGWDWRRSAQLGSVMGSIKIASRGGQNHRIDRAALGV